MRLVMRPRSAALAPFVDSLGYADSALADMRERKVPTATMQLTVNLAEDETRVYRGPDLAAGQRQCGAILCGPFTGPRVSTPRSRVR